jgi:NADPH-dependent curcumin reductase
VWDAVFPLLNPFARIPVCGLIAQYNSDGPFEGPDRLPVVMRAVLTNSLTIRGFIQREFADQRPAFYREMAGWIESGKVKYCEDIVMGLENAPQALIGLLEGRNFGKLLIQIS